MELLQEADGNSGVFFRSHIDGTTISGWQAEVALPGLWTGGIYESYGRGWLVQPPPEKDVALRMGEWNHMRLRAEGPTLTTWLNGEQLVHLTDDQIGKASGHIALQIHDGGGIRVRWRSIRVVELQPRGFVKSEQCSGLVYDAPSPFLCLRYGDPPTQKSATPRQRLRGARASFFR